MKKVITVVAALAIVGSLAASANAANNLWFELAGAPSSTGLAVAGGSAGGSGSALDLSCDVSAGGGSCSWPVRLMLNYQGDGSDIGILAWAMDLFTDGPVGKTTAVFGAYGSPAAFPAANEFPSQPPSFGHYILSGRGRARTDGASNPFGTYELMSFTITKVKPTGDGNDEFIYARVGTGAFGVEDPDFSQFNGQFNVGTNGATAENGAAQTEFLEPVITIDNIPEPTTLSLLALGGLSLIRRRK